MSDRLLETDCGVDPPRGLSGLTVSPFEGPGSAGPRDRLELSNPRTRDLLYSLATSPACSFRQGLLCKPMIIPASQLEKALGSFQGRYLLACLSSGFQPTVVYAAGSQLQLTNLYRAMGANRGHCLGACTTGAAALEHFIRRCRRIAAISAQARPPTA